jgi:hypothetical protein
MDLYVLGDGNETRAQQQTYTISTTPSFSYSLLLNRLYGGMDCVLDKITAMNPVAAMLVRYPTSASAMLPQIDLLEDDNETDHDDSDDLSDLSNKCWKALTKKLAQNIDDEGLVEWLEALREQGECGPLTDVFPFCQTKGEVVLTFSSIAGGIFAVSIVAGCYIFKCCHCKNKCCTCKKRCGKPLEEDSGASGELHNTLLGSVDEQVV